MAKFVSLHDLTMRLYHKLKADSLELCLSKSVDRDGLPGCVVRRGKVDTRIEDLRAYARELGVFADDEELEPLLPNNVATIYDASQAIHALREVLEGRVTDLVEVWSRYLHAFNMEQQYQMVIAALQSIRQRAIDRFERDGGGEGELLRQKESPRQSG